MLGYSEGTGQPSGTAHRVAAFHPDWKGQRAGSQRGPRFQHAHSPAQRTGLAARSRLHCCAGPGPGTFGGSEAPEMGGGQHLRLEGRMASCPSQHVDSLVWFLVLLFGEAAEETSSELDPEASCFGDPWALCCVPGP